MKIEGCPLFGSAFCFLLKMKEREKVVTRIESLAFEGKGIARVGGKVAFVRYAVPGDLVEIEITKDKKSFAEGKIVRIIEPSAIRIAPRCNHFGICGGCSFQNIPYEKQLEWKRKFVTDAFEKIAKVEDVEIKQALPSPLVYGYRNKMEFSFASSRWLSEEEIHSGDAIPNKGKHFALGFHIPERFDKVVNINACHLQDERGNEIINNIRRKALEIEVPAYNLRNHKGFLRNVIVRYSFTNGEVLVNLVTTSQIGEIEQRFLEWFRVYFAESQFVHHLVHTTNDSYSPTPMGNTEIIKGTGYLFEEVGDVVFRISPFSFFQVNTLQANNLIKKTLEFASFEDKIVWDLYSGAGTFSLSLAKYARMVVGVESVPSAVEDARYNAELNKIDNVIFVIKDLHKKKILEELTELPKPDVVVVDPPRTGIHKNLLNALLEIRPERIVYVSCNPATQARDCGELSSLYKIVEVQPIDMFPHTYHIESVALLVKKR